MGEASDQSSFKNSQCFNLYVVAKVNKLKINRNPSSGASASSEEIKQNKRVSCRQIQKLRGEWQPEAETMPPCH